MVYLETIISAITALILKDETPFWLIFRSHGAFASAFASKFNIASMVTQIIGMGPERN